MVKRVCISLLFLYSGAALAMNEEAISQGPVLTVFNTSDLRYKIMTSLYGIGDTEQAIAAFKAFSCIDKVSWSFFRDYEETTLNFVLSLLKFSHYKTKCWNELLRKMTPCLNKKGIENFNTRIQLCTSLIALAVDNKWDSFLLKLREEQFSSWIPTVVQYYWLDSYREGACVHKTLLIKALELNAPTQVVEALCDAGAQVRGLPSTTPPPYLVVMKNYLTCCGELAKVEGDERTVLEDQMNQLQNTMALLIEKGACITESFCPFLYGIQGESPLSSAIEAGNLNMVDHVINKGASSFDSCALSAFYSVSHLDKSSLLFIKNSLCILPGYSEHFLYDLFISPTLKELLEKPELKEEVFNLIADLLDNVKDLNAPAPYQETLTLLDIVHLYGGVPPLNEDGERLISLLVEKGATDKKLDEEKIGAMKLLTVLQAMLNARVVENDIKKAFMSDLTLPPAVRVNFFKQNPLNDAQVEPLLENFLNKMQTAIDTWGLKGVPSLIVENALFLARPYPSCLKAVEFIKALELQGKCAPRSFNEKKLASWKKLFSND